MSERGGPTTQSGILYQNSVAALYLGRLCDATSRPDAERVIEVRVEAPTGVDDVVVTFADTHKAYIQAKESVHAGDAAWRNLWQDFEAEFWTNDFQRGKDRLLLHIGEVQNEHHELRELCDRARHKDYIEWYNRMTTPQQALVEKIKRLLNPRSLSDTNLLAFFGHIEVEIWSLRQIERDMAPYWMPQSDQQPITLFSLLRDRVGGEARHRGSFTSNSLHEFLAANDISLTAPPDLDVLCHSVRECGALLRQHKYTIGSTGKHLKRAVVEEIVAWARETSAENSVAMLLDQAGMGKTVVMRDALCALENTGFPVLAIKADQQLSGITKFDDLQSKLHLPDSVERVVGRLAALGTIVVLVDQIDALSLSLARDQQALDIVLELVARLRLIPGARILLSCRTFDRNTDPKLKRIQLGKQFSLMEFSIEEVKAVLDDVGVNFGMLSPATQKLLRVPLHLDIFVMAIEGRELPSGESHQIPGITSLQGLYALLWQNVILRPEPGSPPTTEREQVLRLLTERMDCDRRTSAPQSVLFTPQTQNLEQAARWLASAGILIPSATEWSFLHQTFFDYCYARQFVESGKSLTENILQSEQGLFARSKLVQVLFYLRGSKPRDYLLELQGLLNPSKLRFHLQDLVMRWFGALLDPTDDEWVIARRMLFDLVTRPRLLRAMHGNRGWFARLAGRPLQDLLSQDDQTLDTQVIPYLASLLEVAQTEVVNIVRPRLGRSEQWNTRLTWMTSMIRNWYSVEAVELFEQLCRAIPQFSHSRFYDVAEIARTHPRAACRLIRLVLDQVLEDYQSKRKDTNDSFLLAPSLCTELESLRNTMLDKVLEMVAQVEPMCFLESMLPWLEQAIQLTSRPEDDTLLYRADDLSYNWFEDTFAVQHTLVHSYIVALSSAARIDPPKFRQIATHLASLPYQTTQQLLAHVYWTVPEVYAVDALQFLLADKRRLDLGDREQYDSRRLVRAIYPFLTDDQRAELEAFILSYTPVWKRGGIRALQLRGLEQLFLLQSIPTDYLTERGQRCLRELEHKFPGVGASESPITMEGGFVGPPIAEDAAKKMSDRAWLRAMRKYHGDVEHKDFLKGGAHELASVLVGLVKENPERFYRLIDRVPDTIDDAYVEAFINGLAESNAPAEWPFNVVRRFVPQAGRDVMRTTAWALQKRIKDGLPDDIMALLENCARGLMGKDETGWEQNDRQEPYESYLNSDRGSTFRTMMRALNQQKSDQAQQHKWKLIEFATTDPSTSLRSGAIEELLYVLHEDREHAISLFERLMDRHPALLNSQHTQEFVRYGIYKYFARMKPFIRALMDSDKEPCQQRGAELACIAAISPQALNSEEQADAQSMATEAVTGSVALRRGAARVYSYNIADKCSVCVQELEKLLNDEDTSVRQVIGGIYAHLRGDHVFSLRKFIEACAASRFLQDDISRFAEYLWEYGLLDPLWTLSVVETVLDNEYPVENRMWTHGSEKLIRLVLRIYNDPTATYTMRERAMDVFDRLMARYAGQAQQVLEEWDQR